jgi:hypothetical protein
MPVRFVCEGMLTTIQGTLDPGVANQSRWSAQRRQAGVPVLPYIFNPLTLRTIATFSTVP